MAVSTMPALGQLGVWRPEEHEWRLGQRVTILPRDQRQHAVPCGVIVGGVATPHLRVALDKEERECEVASDPDPEPEPEAGKQGDEGSTVNQPELLPPSKAIPIGLRRYLVGARDESEETLLPDVVVTAETGDLRRLCRALVRKDERVLEIGCSTGFCTRVLFRSGPPELVVAIDTAYSCIAATEALVSPERETTGCSLEVLKLDALNEPDALCQLVARTQPSVAVVDVGGDRALPEVVSVIDALLRAAGSTSVDSSRGSNHSGCRTTPRSLDLVIVKSEELAGAAAAHMDLIRKDQGGELHEEATIADASLFLPSSVAWWRAQPRGAALTSTSRAQLELRAQQCKKLRQPLKYPKRSAQAGGPMICRFHNYDPVNGCKRYCAGQADLPGEQRLCLLDHEHCHWCLKPGHPAHACAAFLDAAT